MGGHKGGKGKAPDTGGRRLALKVLVPDNLVAGLIGRKGETKDAIQDETGCKLVVSNRAEYFPNTSLRIVIIYSNERDGIARVLDTIIEKVAALGDEEFSNPNQMALRGEPEYAGEKSGEYFLKLGVAVKMSSAIIGSRGANVQAIRQQTNAKVSILKDNIANHQIVKVTGTRDNLRSALTRINELCHEDAASDWYKDWMQVRQFSSDTSLPQADLSSSNLVPVGPPKDHMNDQRGQEEPHGRDAGGGRARSRSRSRDGGSSHWEPWHDLVGDVPEDPPSGAGLKDPAEAMIEICSELDEATLEMEHVVTCHLPGAEVGKLIGVRGEHIQYVERETRTKIRFEKENPRDVDQTLIITGPILRAYQAHAMMMRKYHEEDQPPPKEPEDKQTVVEDLKAQLAALQKQLADAEAGKSVKGKGKGKK